MSNLLKITLTLRKDSTVTIKPRTNDEQFPIIEFANQLTQNQEVPNDYIQTRKRKQTRYLSPDQSQEEQFSSLPCNCAKSRCLKLYCICFHKKQFCNDQCKCENCQNKLQSPARIHAIQNAKYRQKTKYDEDIFDMDQIWGCHCLKSQCHNKYCECYIRNQKCTSQCKCKDCKNTRKIHRK